MQPPEATLQLVCRRLGLGLVLLLAERTLHLLMGLQRQMGRVLGLQVLMQVLGTPPVRATL